MKRVIGLILVVLSMIVILTAFDGCDLTGGGGGRLTGTWVAEWNDSVNSDTLVFSGNTFTMTGRWSNWIGILGFSIQGGRFSITDNNIEFIIEYYEIDDVKEEVYDVVVFEFVLTDNTLTLFQERNGRRINEQRWIRERAR